MHCYGLLYFFCELHITQFSEYTLLDEQKFTLNQVIIVKFELLHLPSNKNILKLLQRYNIILALEIITLLSKKMFVI